jgi:hypothetical protein
MNEYRVYEDPEHGWIVEYRDANGEWAWLGDGTIEHCARLMVEDSKR